MCPYICHDNTQTYRFPFIGVYRYPVVPTRAHAYYDCSHMPFIVMYGYNSICPTSSSSFYRSVNLFFFHFPPVIFHQRDYEISSTTTKHDVVCQLVSHPFTIQSIGANRVFCEPRHTLKEIVLQKKKTVTQNPIFHILQN